VSDRQLFDVRMNDGSRHFAELPEIAWFDEMRSHLKELTGAAETGYVTDAVTEMWLDFCFAGHNFSINNQMSCYWFFVDDPACDDSVLEQVVDHFETINRR
jgi:hypothetical protein